VRSWESGRTTSSGRCQKKLQTFLGGRNVTNMLPKTVQFEIVKPGHFELCAFTIRTADGIRSM
jgi:hypothetical protein